MEPHAKVYKTASCLCLDSSGHANHIPRLEYHRNFIFEAGSEHADIAKFSGLSQEAMFDAMKDASFIPVPLFPSGGNTNVFACPRSKLQYSVDDDARLTFIGDRHLHPHLHRTHL